MVQTTTTLQQAVNDVLIQIGERPASNITNVVARKAVLALEQSLEDINLMNDWLFKRVTRPVTSWSNGVGYVDNFERFFDVTHKTVALRFLEVGEFDSHKQSYVSGAKPRYWTMRDENTIEVYPAPINVIQQQEIAVYGEVSLLPPSTARDNFPIPERLMNLLKCRAVYHMAITHLDDANLAQTKNQEFMLMANRYIQRERNVKVGSLNMFKRRR